MDNHRCKLCSRRFLNGRALGGHMKAHLSFLPPRPASTTASTHLVIHPTLSSTASDDDDEDDAPVIYPKKIIRFSDLDESRGQGGRTKKGSRRVVVGDRGESPEAEPVSSVSDNFPEEDVAMCLMMLCRDDGWMNPSQKKKKKVEDNGADSVGRKKFHQCEICKKCFQSSQALGGHKIIHKKKAAAVVVAKEKVVVVASNRHRNFECPFCWKVFSSGQALGGHKRSHLMGGLGRFLSYSSAVVGDSTGEKINYNNSSIDLNLPAPTEDGDVRSVLSDDYYGGRGITLD